MEKNTSPFAQEEEQDLSADGSSNRISLSPPLEGREPRVRSLGSLYKGDPGSAIVILYADRIPQGMCPAVYNDNDTILIVTPGMPFTEHHWMQNGERMKTPSGRESPPTFCHHALRVRHQFGIVWFNYQGPRVPQGKYAYKEYGSYERRRKKWLRTGAEIGPVFETGELRVMFGTAAHRQLSVQYEDPSVFGFRAKFNRGDYGRAIPHWDFVSLRNKRRTFQVMK